MINKYLLDKKTENSFFVRKKSFTAGLPLSPLNRNHRDRNLRHSRRQKMRRGSQLRKQVSMAVPGPFAVQEKNKVLLAS